MGEPARMRAREPEGKESAGRRVGVVVGVDVGVGGGGVGAPREYSSVHRETTVSIEDETVAVGGREGWGEGLDGLVALGETWQDAARIVQRAMEMGVLMAGCSWWSRCLDRAAPN